MAKEMLRLSGDEDARSDVNDDEIDLRAIVRALWRRKFLLAFIVLLGTGAAAYYVSQVTPLYTAQALLRLDPRETNIIRIEGVSEEFQADPATIESELELLRSTSFARKAVSELGLIDDPEFNWRLRPEETSLLDSLNVKRYLPESWLEAIMPVSTEDKVEVLLEQQDPESVILRDTIGAFKGRMSVSQVGRSYVMSVDVSSESPVKAARLANAVADVYLVSQLEQKYDATREATDFLRQRVEELRTKVVESEEAIAQYRAENRLAAEAQGNTVFMQMSNLNTQLAMARAQRAEAEARLSQVRGLLNSTGGVSAAAKVLSSPLLTDLRSQESLLLREMGELATIYGDRHPQMVNVRAEVQSVRSKMDEEVRRIVQDLTNEVAVTRARETQLQGSVRELEDQATGQDVANVELRDLLREADADRELFETFLKRFNEVVEQQELQQADVSVLSAAEVPIYPSFPRKKLFIAVAFAGSLVAATLLIFIIERWDADYGFRSADEIMSVTGLKALALVPDLTKRELQGNAAEEYILDKPHSAFSEALQRVRTSILLTADGEPAPKTMLITSSVPLEGKSLISCSLARQTANSGLSCLLVDADLRRPRLHEVMRVPNSNGLSEVLAERIMLEEAIVKDERSGTDFLPAGIGAASPPDLYRSERMSRLLGQLKAKYDLVIFDSPPVAAVSDSFVLSGLLDRTLYVVRWEQTPRNVVTHGMRQLVDAGANLAGVIISRVNVKKHAKYGYADSGYYSGYYRKYYVN
ncbi:MAG: GumC family protein [Geminicoccaceae bacterium]